MAYVHPDDNNLKNLHKAMAYDAEEEPSLRVLIKDGISISLPAGISTSALQTAGNGSLSSIDTKLTNQATSALQTTGNGSLSSIDTKLTKGQAVKASSLSVVLASDATTDVIGRTGSICVSIAPSVQPVVSTSAYSTGNLVGGKLTLANVARANVNSGMLQVISLMIKTTQTATYDIVLFNADPSSTSFTDRSAFVINSADISKVICVAHLTDITSFTSTIAQGLNLSIPFALASTTMYAAIVIRGAATFGTTSDVTMSVRIIQD